MTELFMHYPKLTNHYAVDKDPVLRNQMDVLYYATEKVDGTNINLHIDMSTGEYVFGKRTSVIERGDKPFDSVFDLFDPTLIDNLKKRFASWHDVKLHVYGELYGSKIQKTNYNLAKEGLRGLIWYDVIIEHDDGSLVEAPLQVITEDIPLAQQPVFLGVKELATWLSKYTPYDESRYGGVSEGVVLKPIGASVINKEHYPVVKFKTETFAEVRKIPKPKKALTVEHPELLESILAYVTEQRFEHVISHGTFEVDIKNMGVAIKAMQADIAEEFIRENNEDAELVGEYIKRYTSKTIANLIRPRLLGK
jgi:hypothetical protein